MFRLLIIAAIVFSSFVSHTGLSVNAPVWVVEKGSTMKIEGSSNVHGFICDVRKDLVEDTLRWQRDVQSRKLYFQKSVISIDIALFDCHQKFITADFRKTLKANQFPCLKIHFLTLDDPTGVKEGQPIKGHVNIELAGVQRKFDMEYSLVRLTGNRFRLTGSREMRFGDFNLQPPSKLAGMVKINDQIRVSFELLCRIGVS